MKTKVLDKGFVETVDHLGSDLTVVNAARVSFGKRKQIYDSGDRRLVKYLARHKHFSPFRHIIVQFHIKAPEFVMRQWYKHVVGAETSSSSCTKDHAWNEISGRYVPVMDYYRPDSWRAQANDRKQGSSGPLKEAVGIQAAVVWDATIEHIMVSYRKLLDLGLARELARCILPLSQYTEVYWTASFQAIMNFVELRTDIHAQWEIKQYAKVICEEMKRIYPETTKAWLDRQQSTDTVVSGTMGVV